MGLDKAIYKNTGPKWIQRLSLQPQPDAGPDLDLLIEAHKSNLLKAQERGDKLNAVHHARQIDVLLELKKKQEGED